jgi:hypothetical protein
MGAEAANKQEKEAEEAKLKEQALAAKAARSGGGRGSGRAGSDPLAKLKAEYLLERVRKAKAEADRAGSSGGANTAEDRRVGAEERRKAAERRRALNYLANESNKDANNVRREISILDKEYNSRDFLDKESSKEAYRAKKAELEKRRGEHEARRRSFLQSFDDELGTGGGGSPSSAPSRPEEPDASSPDKEPVKDRSGVTSRGVTSGEGSRENPVKLPNDKEEAKKAAQSLPKGTYFLTPKGELMRRN